MAETLIELWVIKIYKGKSFYRYYTNDDNYTNVQKFATFFTKEQKAEKVAKTIELNRDESIKIDNVIIGITEALDLNIEGA